MKSTTHFTQRLLVLSTAANKNILAGNRELEEHTFQSWPKDRLPVRRGSSIPVCGAKETGYTREKGHNILSSGPISRYAWDERLDWRCFVGVKQILVLALILRNGDVDPQAKLEPSEEHEGLRYWSCAASLNRV
mmetsp:Transcript_48308/g.75444  ORF Transcript_48308/g.75444 Transcript_48308/m.75444 type:complete len:134 (-) Transcript_48308:66-467(-)